jgi:hypothetical protein
LIALVVILGVLWSMWYFGCVTKYLPQSLQDMLPKSGYIQRKEQHQAEITAKPAIVVQPTPATLPAAAAAPPASATAPAPASATP